MSFVFFQHCKVRVYTCKVCAATFCYKSQLRSHLATSHTEPAPETRGNQPSNQPGNHPSNQVTDQSFGCRKCEKLFGTKAEVVDHFRVVHPADLEVAEKVGGGRRAVEELLAAEGAGRGGGVGQKENVPGRTGKRSYPCEYCDHTAATQAALKTHLREHDTHDWACPSCDFRAGSIRSLKSHQKRHTNDRRFVEQPLEQYKCRLCGYVCHHLPSLKSHMWRHTAEPQYNYVNISEVINRALYGGEGAGGGEANDLVIFRCCQCGYETSAKVGLDQHMQEHRELIERTVEVNQGRLLPQGKEGGQGRVLPQGNEGGQGRGLPQGKEGGQGRGLPQVKKEKMETSLSPGTA